MTSCSAGIAICPDDADNRETLLNHADTAAISREDGRPRDLSLLRGENGRKKCTTGVLEHDLRQGSGAGEFKLVYQPQNDIQTNTVIGFEALLRWNHKTRGSISPGLFIPIAEETGAILGVW